MPRTPDRTSAVAAVLVASVVLTGVHTGTAAPARSDGPASGWRWPLAPRPGVQTGFDPPDGPYTAGHRGVDLVASVAQPVLAAGPGVVAFAGQVAGRGVVSVAHHGGLRTTYEPVTAVVTPGDEVRSGDPLGTVSAAPGHCLPATCVHWGLRRGESYLDPLLLLGTARVRLLPVWTAPAGGLLDALPDPAPPVTPPAAPVRDRGPLMARG